jgi:hypothetical protein
MEKLRDKCIASQGEYFDSDYVVEIFREIHDFLKKLLVTFGSPHVWLFA